MTIYFFISQEKINVKFPKIIIKGDQKWKSPSRDESAQEKAQTDLERVYKEGLRQGAKGELF